MFFKNLKRLVCFTVILTLSVVCILPTFAQTEPSVNETVQFDGSEYSISKQYDNNGDLTVTVKLTGTDETVTVKKTGDVLYYEMSVDGVSVCESVTIDLNNLEDTSTDDNSGISLLRASSSVQAPFWGYYAYYSSGSRDFYWSLINPDRSSQGSISYRADIGSSLHSYSEGFYNDVSTMSTNLYGAQAISGISVIAAILSALASINPVTAIPATIAAIVAALGGAAAIVPFIVSAWYARDAAKLKYETILILK
ncbi:MAG: hypothetical protein LBR54_04855 [Oscillospiraceae bacterium]|jgi:hypothetical protein|nr:hypothetical protein [Oscillospiraceae bacterium]